MNEIIGMPGEESAYRDKRVRKRALPEIRMAMRRHLLPGERVLGLFSAYRIRRSISLLVVTDRRLLTFGEPSVGLPLVDDLDRSQVTEVTIERLKVFTTGAVAAHTPEGKIGLGTLNYGNETFNALEEVLSRGVRPGMPLIPTPTAAHRGAGRPGAAHPGAEPADTPAGSAAGAPSDATGTHPGATTAPQHPLVAQLSALADLHVRGALTDEEFTAAKQKLIADF